MDLNAVCERYGDAFLGQPANAVTSGAFVLAGVGILVAGRRIGTPRNVPVRDRHTLVFGLLVSGIGVGSFIQHGPNPDWQAYAHDLPLAAVLLFVTADAMSDLCERDLSPAWWFIPYDSHGSGRGCGRDSVDHGSVSDGGHRHRAKPGASSASSHVA